MAGILEAAEGMKQLNASSKTILKMAEKKRHEDKLLKERQRRFKEAHYH